MSNDFIKNVTLKEMDDLWLDRIEILSLIGGIKPMYFNLVSERKKESVKNFAEKIGFNCHFPGESEVRIDLARQLKIKSDSVPLIICKDIDDGIKFEKNYYKNNDFDKFIKVGELLGYPKCCSFKFIKFLPDKKQTTKIRDYYYHITQNSKNFSPFANSIFCIYGRGGEEGSEKIALLFKKNRIFLSNFFTGMAGQVYFIPYAPCYFDCKKSIDYGKKVYSLLKNINGKKATKTLELLSKPVLYFNLYEFIIFDGKADRKRIIYDRIYPYHSLIDNKITEKIRKGDEIIISDKEIEILKKGVKIFSIAKKEKEDGFIIPFSPKQ